MLAPISLGLIGPMGFMLAISILGHRKPKAPPKPSSDSLVINKTISEEEARSRQDELRVLTVRLGALRSLIERLRASHEQGSITDGEFNALAQKHVDEMRQLEQDIVRRRLVVELFELEGIEEKLAKAFTTKINELNETILLIRSKLGVEAEGREFMVVPPIQEAPMGAGQASTTSDQCAHSIGRRSPDKPSPVREQADHLLLRHRRRTETRHAGRVQTETTTREEGRRWGRIEGEQRRGGAVPHKDRRREAPR
jgi:hypothetical protein